MVYKGLKKSLKSIFDYAIIVMVLISNNVKQYGMVQYRAVSNYGAYSIYYFDLKFPMVILHNIIMEKYGNRKIVIISHLFSSLIDYFICLVNNISLRVHIVINVFFSHTTPESPATQNIMLFFFAADLNVSVNATCIVLGIGVV